MQFEAAGLPRDGGDVARAQPCAGHDADPAGRLRDQRGQYIGTGVGAGLAAGRQHPLAAQPDHLLQRRRQIARGIEGTVEGHLQRAGRAQQFAAQRQVDIALRIQRTDHHALAAQRAALGDVAQHQLGFQRVVVEIPRTRPHQHEQRNCQALAGDGDAGKRRRGTAFGKVVEQFDAICTTGLRGQRRSHRIAGDLQRQARAHACVLV
ncbi:hypothetical protein D3C71_1258240 [compost metagenome]